MKLKIKNWVDLKDTNKTLFGLAIILLSNYLFQFITDNVYVYIFIICIGLVIPFLMLVLVLTNNKYYKQAKDITWLVAMKYLIVFVYTAYAGIWAASEVNAAFEINASHFPVTIGFMTLIYFLITFMKPFLIEPLYIFILVFGWFIFLGIVFYKNRAVNKIRMVVLFILTVVLVSVTYANIGNLMKNKQAVIEKIADWGDFYKHHRCDVDLIGGDITGVIFLPSGNVFVQQIGQGKKWSYDIKQCRAKEKS